MAVVAASMSSSTPCATVSSSPRAGRSAILPAIESRLAAEALVGDVSGSSVPSSYSKYPNEQPKKSAKLLAAFVVSLR